MEQDAPVGGQHRLYWVRIQYHGCVPLPSGARRCFPFQNNSGFSLTMPAILEACTEACRNARPIGAPLTQEPEERRPPASSRSSDGEFENPGSATVSDGAFEKHH